MTSSGSADLVTSSERSDWMLHGFGWSTAFLIVARADTASRASPVSSASPRLQKPTVNVLTCELLSAISATTAAESTTPQLSITPIGR
jgi:hypothetical protein